MLLWYVVDCQQGREYTARDNLREQGFEVYLPEYVRRVRHARRVQKVKRPLFHHYIFVEFDLEERAWRCINGTRGVRGIMCGSDQRPRHIRPSDMLALREVAALHAEEIHEEFPISLDDVVMIASGAFNSFFATVKKISASGNSVTVEPHIEVLGGAPR